MLASGGGCNAQALSSAGSGFRAGGAVQPRQARNSLPLSSSLRPNRRAVDLVLAAKAREDHGQQQQQDKTKRRELLAAGMAGPILAATGGGALAVPTTPPDLTKCQPAYPSSTSTTTVQCCLPTSASPPVIYVPKPGKVPKVRKRANAVDAAYAAKYNEAYRRMRALPDSDPRSLKQQADVHCAFCNGAYPSPLNSSLTLQVMPHPDPVEFSSC
jgi:polyphenol oxidase